MRAMMAVALGLLAGCAEAEPEVVWETTREITYKVSPKVEMWRLDDAATHHCARLGFKAVLDQRDWDHRDRVYTYVCVPG